MHRNINIPSGNDKIIFYKSNKAVAQLTTLIMMVTGLINSYEDAVISIIRFSKKNKT